MNMGVWSTYQMLSCARHGDSLTLKGAQVASLYFGSGQKNDRLSQTTCPIRIIAIYIINALAMRHQGKSVCAISGSAPSKVAGGELTFEFGIFSKSLLTGMYQAVCTELNIGTPGACRNVNLSAWRLVSDKGGSGGAPLILAMDTKTTFYLKLAGRFEPNLV